MKIAVRSTPSTSQKRSAEPSQSLIRLVAPDGDDEEQPDGEQQREEDRQAPGEAADLLLFFAIGELRVGGDRERPEADLQRLAERDNAADDRQPQIRLRFAQETIGSEVTSMRALGGTAGDRPGRRRLASSRPRAPPGPRPARRRRRPAFRPACARSGRPPDAPRWIVSRARGSTGALGGTTAEPLDPAAGVNQLLLARVEGMALRADLHVKLGLRGARVEVVPARAVDVREDVLGVDFCLHRLQV